MYVDNFNAITSTIGDFFFFHYRRPLMIVVETFYQLHEQENWKANSLNSRGKRTERSHCGATFDTLRYIPEELPILYCPIIKLRGHVTYENVILLTENRLDFPRGLKNILLANLLLDLFQIVMSMISI